jgi:hypothetical protein
MNIQDMKGRKAEGDMLIEIFDAQRELMEKYGTSPATDLNDPKNQKLIREFSGYVVEELMEAMNCLRNKPWVKTQTKTDEDHYYEELADAVHFFVELLVISGLDAVDVHELYFKKNSVNHFRIKTKY